METEKMKKIRFFPIWEEEKENGWLERMSQLGWHFIGRGFLSYFFERRESREYIYRYDFKLTTDRDYADYRQIFEESGWELVSVFANWHYFRHEKGTGAEDIYTDAESKKRRHKRLLVLMAALAAMNIVIMSNNIFLMSIADGGLRNAPVFIYFLWGIMTTVILLLVYAAVRIFISMKKLNKSIKE